MAEAAGQGDEKYPGDISVSSGQSCPVAMTTRSKLAVPSPRPLRFWKVNTMSYWVSLAGINVDRLSGRDVMPDEHPELRGEVLAQHDTGVEFAFTDIRRTDAELLHSLDRLGAKRFDKTLIGGSAMLAMLANMARSFMPRS